MIKKPIYMDCAATTPVDSNVANIVLHAMMEEFGNAGSRTHIWGTEAKKIVNLSREQVSAVVNAEPSDVVFTSGATEANNLALLGLENFGVSIQARHIISSQIEHKAGLEPLYELQKRGFEVTLLPPTHDGLIDPEEIKKSLRSDTVLVSIMHVNNETGAIQPIEDICDVLQNHSVYFHVDAAQGYGKDLIPLKNPRIDFISLSGHKIGAPKGIGALIMRKRGMKRAPLTPIIFGGGQENNLRAGTHAVPLIAGLGFAAQKYYTENEAWLKSCSKINDQLIDMLLKLNFVLIGNQSKKLPNIVSVAHPIIDSEAIIIGLKDVVAISNGSACTSENYDISHVLNAMKIPQPLINNVTRWSWDSHTLLPDFETLRSHISILL